MPAGVDWLPLDTAPCPRCSQSLCLESTSSATALTAQLHAIDPGAYAADLDFDALVDDVVSTPAAHQLAREALLQAALRIGANLADVTRMLDPEVVILGGKLARAEGIVSQAVADALSSASIGDAATELRVVAPDEVRYSEARGGIVLAVQAASDRLIAEPMLQS
jgi:predicted NBD/HSP70 family sugar kinase